MKIIIVSGTPGTGKTFVAKKIAAKFNFKYLDVKKLISKNKLFDGVDKKRKSKIVDTKKLNKILIKEITLFKKSKNKYQGLIIDSHLSHFLPKKYVNLCIITKCDIKILNQRLKKRRYSKTKVEENLQSEIFEVCEQEAAKLRHRIIIIDTTKGFKMDKVPN